MTTYDKLAAILDKNIPEKGKLYYNLQTELSELLHETTMNNWMEGATTAQNIYGKAIDEIIEEKQ